MDKSALQRLATLPPSETALANASISRLDCRTKAYIPASSSIQRAEVSGNNSEAARNTGKSGMLSPDLLQIALQIVRVLLVGSVDHCIGFTYGTAFVARALERFVRDLAPDLAQLSLRQLVVPEGISVA